MYHALRLLPTILLPHGRAVHIPPRHRPHCSSADVDNASLRLTSSPDAGGTSAKIYERLEHGGEPLLVNPETIIFDDVGTMYVMNEYSMLVSLTDIRRDDGEDDDHYYYTARTNVVADLGIGRPLGGKYDPLSKCLYYADAILGLARVCDLPHGGVPNYAASGASVGGGGGGNDDGRPRVELIANRFKLQDGSWSAINYADDVDIGSRTGHVYFTDASDIGPDRVAAVPASSSRDDHGGGMMDGAMRTRRTRWDVMYASKLEGLRGSRSGRLLRYRPESGEVDVLATNVAFANGVSLIDEDEEYVIYTSTFGARVMIHRLDDGNDSDDAEEDEVLLDGFPGLLDGIDCPRRRGGTKRICHVAIATTLPLPLVALMSLPSYLGIAIRSLLMMMPRSWSPSTVSYGGVAEIRIVDAAEDNDDEKGNGNEEETSRRRRRRRTRGVSASITRIFQDPDGRDFSTITGVTEYDGKVYLGTLHGNYVGVISLE
jgi:hypothetical protein